MKKVMLVIALLLVSFFGINVKAEGVEIIDAPIVEEKEEIKEVKEEVKAEAPIVESTNLVKTTADDENETTYDNVNITVTFKNINPSDSTATKEYTIVPGGTKTIKYSDIIKGDKVNIDSESTTYNFVGFKLEDYSSSNLTVTNDSNNKRIKLAYTGGTITNKEVVIYVDWSKKAYPVVTFNIYDIKNGETSYIVYTKDEVISPGGSHTSRLDLDQVFFKRTASTGVRYSGVDKGVTEESNLDDGLKTYSFVGYYIDSNRETEITSSYKPTGSDATGFKKLYTNKTQLIYQTNGSASDNVTINVYAHWDTTVAPILEFNYNDEVSTGSGSWKNNGASDDFAHQFRAPESKTHYQFLYWKIDNDTYNDGESFTYSFKGKENNTVEKVTANAYWQADVTVNLYSDGKLVSSESSFESVTINDLADKDYEDFVRWVDANGNEVTEKTFYPNELGTNPEPVEINLYAEYKLVRRDIEVNKVWEDEDNESGKRPSSVTVTLKADEEEIDEAELSEENSWTHKFKKVNIYNEDNEEINYTVEEKNVPAGYEAALEGDMKEGFTIHNALGQGDGEPDTPHNNPQTGDNIVLYLITLTTSLAGLIVCTKKYRFE